MLIVMWWSLNTTRVAGFNVWGGGVNSQSAARKKHYLRRIVYKRFMYEENLNA